MKLRHLAVAGAVAAACSGAWAEDYVVNNIDLSDGSAFFGVLHYANGSFTDVFNFNPAPPGASAASASLITISLGDGVRDINFSGADLNGTSFSFGAPGAIESGAVIAFNLTAPFSITVTGVASGVGEGQAASYSGTLNITPVPEPETYALMLAGLGAIGFMARRRRS